MNVNLIKFVFGLFIQGVIDWVVSLWTLFKVTLYCLFGASILTLSIAVLIVEYVFDIVWKLVKSVLYLLGWLVTLILHLLGGLVTLVLILIGWASYLTCWACTGRRQTWCAHAYRRQHHPFWRAWVAFFDRVMKHKHPWGHCWYEHWTYHGDD